MRCTARATMPPAEQRERMASLRMTVREFNVYRWAGRMLADAGRWRLRERIEARVQRHTRTDDDAAPVLAPKARPALAPRVARAPLLALRLRRHAGADRAAARPGALAGNVLRLLQCSRRWRPWR